MPFKIHVCVKRFLTDRFKASAVYWPYYLKVGLFIFKKKQHYNLMFQTTKR